MSSIDLDLKLALDALDARQVPPAAPDWEERLHTALGARPTRLRRARLRLLVAACVAVAVFAFLASGAGAWVGLPNPFGSGFRLLGPTHHVASPASSLSPTPSAAPSHSSPPSPSPTATATKRPSPNPKPSARPTVSIVAWPPAPAALRDEWRRHWVGASVELVSVHFSSPTDGWATGGPHARLFVTTDGGATWFSRGAAFDRWLTRVVSIDAAHGWVLGSGAHGSVIRGTTNGGATWTQTRSTAWLRGIAQVGAHAWAVGYGLEPGRTGARIVATSNGATWVERRIPHVRMLRDVAFVDTRHGWAVGGNAIVATSNGGATWARQPLLSSIDLYAVAFSDRRHGWAAGAYVRGPLSGRAVVLGTTDGGAHWRRLTLGDARTLITGLAFADARHGWAVGEDARTRRFFVIVTRDGGLHWQTELSSAQALHAIAVLPPHGACVVGAGGTVLTTTGRP